MREQVAREMRALVAHVGYALLAVGLGAHDLVRILDPPARDSQRELVREKACGERSVDGERHAVERCEHQLRRGPRKARALGKGARDEHRLPAAARLGLDHE